MGLGEAIRVQAQFVGNAQDGADDCAIHDLSPDQLHALLGHREQMIEGPNSSMEWFTQARRATRNTQRASTEANPRKVIMEHSCARKPLLTRRGFFIGSYEPDECRLEDVMRMRDCLRETLVDINAEAPGETSYFSSLVTCLVGCPRLRAATTGAPPFI